MPTDAETLTRTVLDHLLQRWPGRILISGALAGILAPSITRPHELALTVQRASVPFDALLATALGVGTTNMMEEGLGRIADERLVTLLDAARRDAPLLQFLEQAFEWSNMTYILYPYFWASSGGDKAKIFTWSDLDPIESADPDFDRLPRSGSARVVVSARPGFEPAVNHFTLFGDPWGGGPAPVPGDELYLSVTQEIKDLTGAPNDGEPDESWESRVPTTLVWLDPDSALPKQNERRRLTKPPDSICEPTLAQREAPE